MTMAKPAPYADPADCFICRRRAEALGLGPPNHDRWAKNPRWVCEDCIPQGREARIVRNFDPYELRARTDAGEKAGAYLDALGKTDLATLTAEEWQKFLTTVIHEFGQSLRTQIAELRAPF